MNGYPLIKLLTHCRVAPWALEECLVEYHGRKQVLDKNVHSTFFGQTEILQILVVW